MFLWDLDRGPRPLSYAPPVPVLRRASPENSNSGYLALSTVWGPKRERHIPHRVRPETRAAYVPQGATAVFNQPKAKRRKDVQDGAMIVRRQPPGLCAVGLVLFVVEPHPRPVASVSAPCVRCLTCFCSSWEVPRGGHKAQRRPRAGPVEVRHDLCPCDCDRGRAGIRLGPGLGPGLPGLAAPLPPPPPPPPDSPAGFGMLQMI